MTFDLDAFRLSVLNDPLARDIWDTKYRHKSPDGTAHEVTVNDTRRRVVDAIYKDDPSTEHLVRAQRLVQGGFLVPAGRINAGAGLDRAVTLMNCFLNEVVDDSMVGIQRAIMNAALTMQQGGGIGTDWSTVRPAGAVVKRTGSISSGVIPFMDQMDAMCQTVSSAGARRGAMMGTLRDDHPDLWNENHLATSTTFDGREVLSHPSFISAKRQRGRLTQFNVSVLVSDALMDAIKNDKMWDMGFHVPRADGHHLDVYDKPFSYNEEGPDGRKKGDMLPWYVYRRVLARQLWDEIMRSTYTYAEPGVIFIDRVNRMNNLNYCEDIRCTNPCGEQPLPPHGICDLASVNLAFMIKDPFTHRADIDWNLLTETVHEGVRFLDNVLDATQYPLEAQRLESMLKRRIGLGVTGWADALAQLGVRYGSDDSVALSRQVARVLQWESYTASAYLAQERGPFPLYNKDELLKSQNIAKIPAMVRTIINRHGLRNGVLNTVAPNGTISIYIGNVGSGIEPFFTTAASTRRVRQPDHSFVEYRSVNYGVRLWEAMFPGKDLPDYFVGALEVPPAEHVLVQAAWQRNIDAAISKTVNCPETMTFEEFASVYALAYAEGCKGCTTYRPDPTAGRGSVLVADGPLFEGSTRNEAAVEYETGEKTAPDLTPRPEVLTGRTYKLKWPLSGENTYVTVNSHDGAPVEVFIRAADPLVNEWSDALGRMLTGVLRRGGDVRFVVEQLSQVASARGGAFMHGAYRPSLVAAIAWAVGEEFRDLGVYEDRMVKVSDVVIVKVSTEPSHAANHHEVCPSCGTRSFVRESGCHRCLTCGHEACG